MYVITNPAMPGLLKVGYTTNTPEQRAMELGGTGVPASFIVAYSLEVLDPPAIEQMVHRHLHEFHYGKEFFRCDVEVAIAAIKSFVGEKTIREQEEEKVLKYEFRHYSSLLPALGSLREILRTEAYNYFSRNMASAAARAPKLFKVFGPRDAYSSTEWESLSKEQAECHSYIDRMPGVVSKRLSYEEFKGAKKAGMPIETLTTREIAAMCLSWTNEQPPFPLRAKLLEIASERVAPLYWDDYWQSIQKIDGAKRG